LSEGCAAPARWIGKLSWLDSIIFGILMNTKGLVALISLNLGISAGIITERFFTMCVIMVLVNTIITGPLVALIYKVFKRTDLMPCEFLLLTLRRTKFLTFGFYSSADVEGGNAARVLVYVSNEKTAPLIVCVSSLLFQTEDNVKMVLLRIYDRSDRPSDYMSKFSLVAMRRDPVLRLSMKAAKAFEAGFKVSKTRPIVTLQI